ncbi:MAG TPA: amidohydrolase family protein [Candidatus Latescibacteria bacterium]|jgi:L-fuconolactonase|nr:amidohydrolase family protein [Candidatus Latescibacterota bacterium]HJP32217.1 amidohydrolase family protein [Candidatus Latescibacterota bacterium]
MAIVDTHCHAGLLKYEPVESLLRHMQVSGVEQAVLIQYAGNTDNEYLVDCLSRFPGKLAAAMIVPEDDDGTAVRQWADRGIQGIRLALKARAKPTDGLAQWRAAAETGLVVSAPCRPAWLLSSEFFEVVDTFPDLAIVIEHLGGIGADAAPPYDEFRSALEGLSGRPNVSMKLPGFGEFCRVPMPFEPIPPLARMALDAFGPQRLMWGSDYPPVSSREGYDNSLRVPMEYFADLSETDRSAIFGDTARAIWQLPDDLPVVTA